MARSSTTHACRHTALLRSAFSAACASSSQHGCLTELEQLMLKPCGVLCCAVLLLFAVQARLLVPSTALCCTWGC